MSHFPLTFLNFHLSPDGATSFPILVVVVTTANTDEEGKALLTLLGFPFRK